MSYSKLANASVPIMAKCNTRYCGISKITPHYMAGDMTAYNCACYHRDANVQSSANYYIGSDGKIVAGVPEEHRAWTSASEWNDQRAITFECANVDASGKLSDACYKSLVALCADICKRYNITPHYDGTVNGSITMHRMFSATACPGPWLTGKIVSGQLEKDIKAAMNPQPVKVEAAKVKKIEKGKERSVYRLYNPNNGGHLYTTNVDEANLCQDGGWTYEGIAWIYPSNGDPVWRLRNPASNIFHFTADEKEKNALVKLGWKNEGIVMRSAGSIPIYRMYNPNSGSHVLTASKKEHDALTKAGWTCEGLDLRAESL